MSLNRRSLLVGGVAAGLTAAAGSRLASAATTPSTSKIRTIGLEEHCIPKEVYDLWVANDRAARANDYMRLVYTRLVDFEGQRLEDMDRAGIEMTVLSLTTMGPQGEADAARAGIMAHRANDALAQQIARHPDRFAGFACLSMHDPDAASRELERCVKNLGFVGVLLNNWQRAGANGDKALYYDDRRYDEFWDTAQRLDAPVYLHPGWTPPWYEQSIAGFPLGTATWTWAVETGTHALRIITSGVFDRYPRAQMILGHNGEHIVTDLWRIEDRLHSGWRRLKGQPLSDGDGARPYSVMKMSNPQYRAERTVSSYFRTNVTVTTSAQFNDAGLQHIIKEIGVDRVMFSTDYPWEDMVEAGDWFNATPLGDEERFAIARGNHLKLLKLPLKA